MEPSVSPTTEPTINNITNMKSNIKLEFDTGVISEDTILEVDTIVDGIVYDNIKQVLSDINKFVAFDINLILNGAIIQPNGIVRLSIPVPEGFNMEKLVAYRIGENGKEEYKVNIISINNVNYAQFETDHFSTYVIAEDDSIQLPEEDKQPEKPEHKLDEEPKTGTVNKLMIAAVSLVLAVLGYAICRQNIYKN